MPRELRQGLPLLIRPVARKRVCRRLLLPSAASPSTMGGLALWGRGGLALSGASNGRSHPCSESQILCQSPDLLFVFGRLCCWAVLTMRPRPCTHRVPFHHGKRGPLWTPPSLITLRGVNTTWQSPASPLPVRIVPPCSPKACIVAPVVAHFPGDLPAFTGNHACPPSKQDLPTRGCEGQSQTLLTSCSARSLLEPSRQSGFPDEQAPRKD